MAQLSRREEGQRPTDSTAPPAPEVEKYHTNDDLDTRPEAHHHSLGAGENQASPGSHTHDGGNSALLLSGLTITGSRGSSTAMSSIIACLVRLGATDNSSA